ncbi:MAG TPA: hypothetical protein PKE39_04445 [Ignavibacteria bacterium]|nr:hypothetical protein [Ignavibacteria bacterium]HMQ98252.1 hypothetical protein [Ignavibacteria bacterium]
MNLIQNPITPQQRGMIFGLAKDCKLSNDQLHDLMPSWSGAHSLKQNACTKAQADKIIEALKAMKDNTVDGVACPPQSRVSTGNIGKPGFITQNQYTAINKICAAKKWNIEHLNNFIKHTTGTLTADELTMKEASAVITGLKKI